MAMARRRFYDNLSNEDGSVESVSTGEFSITNILNCVTSCVFGSLHKNCLFVFYYYINFIGESGEELSQALKFYEVDAPGDDYVDFGAYTGPHGSFSWHANYPLEK